jgi:hypothetical protein
MSAAASSIEERALALRSNASARSEGDQTGKKRGRLKDVSAVDSEGKPRKQADVLLDIGQTHKLFHDSSGTPYARIRVLAPNTNREHLEVHAIETGAYREVLAEAYWCVTRKGCNRNALADAVTTLSALAKFAGEAHPVYLRTGCDHDRLFIDTGNANWDVIEVSAEGWSIAAEAPYFRRAGAPLALPEPGPSDFSRLWRFANVRAEHRPLIAGFLLAALRPTGPYPQLHLSGEQGSGKSTLVKVLKSLVDPSSSPLRAAPKDVRDLLVGALNGWCLALDNVSFIAPELSDALCRLATGGAISERTLYSNTDETLVEVQRPVIINGIEDLAIRPDLAERGLHVELTTIRDRKSERTFWAEFKADAPHIFAALLDGLSLAIRDHALIELGPLPRMADFAQWAAAGVPALGFTADEFIEAYRSNNEEGMSAGIDSSPVGRALLKFMQLRSQWEGSADALLRELSRETDENVQRSQAWPKSPRGLSGAVRRLAPSLRLLGVEVSGDRTATERRVLLCKRGNGPSQPSRSSLRPSPSDGTDANDGPDRVLHSESESGDEQIRRWERSI